MCPLTMRTQSILLIKDTILVLNSHSTDGNTNPNTLLWVAVDLYYRPREDKQSTRIMSPVGFCPEQIL